MSRMDELDAIELEDAARCLDRNYTPEKFASDLAEFVQIKKSVHRHRAKVARRATKRRTVH